MRLQRRSRHYVLTTLSDKADLSEFENNLLICAKLEGIERRTAALPAILWSIFAGRLNGKQSARGTLVSSRYKKLALTYLGCSSFDSQYGTCYIHKFSEDATGARLIWKTGTDLNLPDNHKMVATFTVKEHGEYNGWAQTQITRLVD